jgi:hypothetical protein
MFGLKENVISGKTIPAGTGFQDFQDLIVTVNQSEDVIEELVDGEIAE